ncbi:hypothetical protein [endosymbiont GvMRE of Glomus versiforme]|uniref:hypothetical protein n=1 Tax=endosymbiont GvMRE of Glomus versiforme TaxID=2039283 RepID=UPI000EE6CB44|nr:hypothetical protein [endosymbiont GvMRE of Glomus versiforme]RHZ35316.1 hypothetical protein GvMRE_IIg149 [endosymbiont GvMRE of Glomus versiforme]
MNNLLLIKLISKKRELERKREKFLIGWRVPFELVFCFSIVWQINKLDDLSKDAKVSAFHCFVSVIILLSLFLIFTNLFRIHKWIRENKLFLKKNAEVDRKINEELEKISRL